MSYPVETTTGETVVIVDKEPLGEQGVILLTDENGNLWTSDTDGLQVRPYEGATGARGTVAREGDL